jgi:uncharacterized membrane protein YfcA
MTALTLMFLSYLGTGTDTVNNLVTSVLALALFGTSFVLIFRRRIIDHYADYLARVSTRQIRNMTIAMGALLGVLVSISSVGAGAIGVTALILLYPKLPMARIVGSDIAHAVPLTLIAGMGHWWLGLTDLTLLSSLLVGSIPGIIVGSYAAPRIPDPALRYILAGTLLLVGGRLSSRAAEIPYNREHGPPPGPAEREALHPGPQPAPSARSHPLCES